MCAIHETPYDIKTSGDLNMINKTALAWNKHTSLFYIHVFYYVYAMSICILIYI